MTTETGTTAVQEPAAVPFRAEVRQLLQILAHALYTDREIFLRELISNASDAIHRVQFEQITTPDLFDALAEPAIRISVDEEAKTISISDSGIGMTREELIENLGTIAHSSARNLLEKLEAAQRSNIIGQFGVGFYSAFVVADDVTVISRSFRPDAEAAMWRSTGGDTFEVGPAEKAERGTTVILKLKEDASEFATSWRLKQIVKKHSDFVAFPIYVGDEQANQQTALWRQAPRNVEADKYNEFYRQLTYDFTDPMLYSHISTDAPVDLHSILFVPGKRERGLIERRVDGKIKLYSRKILIQEEAKDLLPNHLRFIEGVVDSEDLPLNVSREMVQKDVLSSNSPVLQRIKKTLNGRFMKSLSDLAEKDADKYIEFWQEFGIFLKEGVASDYSARDELLPLLRFYTTKSEDKQVALADYKSRMADGQTEIYYVLANDLASAKRSPHLDILDERGLEALLFVDVMDSFMLSGLREFDGMKLRNMDDSTLELPGGTAAPEALVSDEAFARLVTRIKEVLDERASSVRASNVLRNHPIRLVSPESEQQREMARIQRMVDQNYKVPAKIIEVNRSHPLIADLARIIENGGDAALDEALIEQLYDNALLVEGLHPNPADMVARIQALMEAAARK
ncbi:MAG: molecular chaperone HtpG [Roseiflexaceae bacterium]|nr:molecular chaperone HtpG [Roseiflexaceae bacterium]